MGQPGEVIRLSGLVSLQNVSGGMFQVLLGQPEAVLWSVSLEPDQVFRPFVMAYQSVGNDIFHLEFLFVIHSLRGWGLAGWANFRRPGMIGFQVLHIVPVKWGQPGKPWGDLHPNSVGPADL